MLQKIEARLDQKARGMAALEFSNDFRLLAEQIDETLAQFLEKSGLINAPIGDRHGIAILRAHFGESITEIGAYITEGAEPIEHTNTKVAKSEIYKRYDDVARAMIAVGDYYLEKYRDQITEAVIGRVEEEAEGKPRVFAYEQENAETPGEVWHYLAIHSFDGTLPKKPLDLDAPCPLCGSKAEGFPHDGWFHWRCQNWECRKSRRIAVWKWEPSATEVQESPLKAPLVHAVWVEFDADLSGRGLRVKRPHLLPDPCPECGFPREGYLTTENPAGIGGSTANDPILVWRCRNEAGIGQPSGEPCEKSTQIAVIGLDDPGSGYRYRAKESRGRGVCPDCNIELNDLGYCFNCGVLVDKERVAALFRSMADQLGRGLSDLERRGKL